MSTVLMLAVVAVGAVVALNHERIETLLGPWRWTVPAGAGVVLLAAMVATPPHWEYATVFFAFLGFGLAWKLYAKSGSE